MKKKYLLFITILLLTMTGCGEKTAVMECKRSINQGSIKIDANYKVTYTGKYVDSVKSVEKVKYTGDDDTILDTYKDSIEQVYNSYVDLDGYNNEVKVKDDTLTSTTDIDYKKVDTDKLIEIDSSNKLIVKDGKISVNDMKNVYENMGIICDK